MNLPESLNELAAGDVVELDNITQLAAFEDIVAQQIDPEMSTNHLEAWQGRVALSGLLRPAKFNGTIADIQLVVMGAPYERRLDARERGYKGMNAKRPPSSQQSVIDSYRGFTFLANAKSTGRGVIGQIQTELWYYAVPSTKPADAFGRRRSPASNVYAGASVHRTVTAPKIEKEAFFELNETSKRIALNVLRGNLRRPITQHIRN